MRPIAAALFALMSSNIGCIRSLPCVVGLALDMTVPPGGGSLVISLCGGASGDAPVLGAACAPVSEEAGASVLALSPDGDIDAFGCCGSGELAVQAASARTKGRLIHRT